MTSYVSWANKGGIGKSTMTFQLACETAIKNPRKKIYIIDLSPQCDVSRMALGGGHYTGEDIIINIMKDRTRKTVQTYLMNCLNDVAAGNGWPDPHKLIIEPNKYRLEGTPELPNNLRLMCGDFDLERTIQLIDQMPQPPKRSGRAASGPEFSKYLLSRSFIRHATQMLSGTKGNKVFIDTDPYFNVITTHMGLFGADNLISAYSPSSQASQFAVTRSIEFIYDNIHGFTSAISSESTQYPTPWYDYKGNRIVVPPINVAKPYILLPNMVNPYKRSGNKSYSDPQKLHRVTIEKFDAEIKELFNKYSSEQFKHTKYMWDLRRLGLICDFNGIPLSSLKLGENYPEPGSSSRYHLNSSGGTPGQLKGYHDKIGEIAALL